MTDTTTAQAGTGDTTAASTTTLADGGGATTESTAATTTTDAGTQPATTTETTTETKPVDTADWRTRIAGEDKDFLKTLNRYASEADFGKAHRSLQTKLSSGEAKRTLAENASPEELATWRKENGIPDAPEGYKEVFPEGVDPKALEGPVVELFKQFAHKENWTPDQFNKTLGFWANTREAIAELQSEKDQAFQLTAEDDLRKEYGNDYRRNMNALGNFRDQMPEGLAQRLMGGRMADGTLIGNDPQMIKWMVQTAIDFDPAATLVPVGTSNGGKAISDEIAQIETTMRNEPDKYWKNEDTQKRYRDLLDARSKMQSRAA